MHYLNENLKFLRRKKGLTQQELADELGVNRANIGSYEENRSEPRLGTMLKICNYFQITVDELLITDLNRVSSNDMAIAENEKLRILSVVVDNQNEEMITFVPIKATAGYLEGYGDIDFINELPKFNLPFPEISRGRTYRAFEIKGDSMLPIQAGSYILCEYTLDIKTLKSDNCYILVTKDEGIVYKRVSNRINEDGTFYLKSDNNDYESYAINGEYVKEAWKAIGYLSFDLPGENSLSFNELSGIVMDLQNELKSLKNKGT